MFTHDEHVWTTVVSVCIDDAHAANAAAATRDIIAFLHDVDLVFSTFRNDSLISAVRADAFSEDDLFAASRLPTCDAREPYVSRGTFTGAALRDMGIVMAQARYAAYLTAGAFDAWRGGLDLSGIVKGWAADRSLRIMRSYGLSRGYVNAGGDIACMSDGKPWSVGIADPLDTGSIIKAVDIANGGVATSGTYERGAHIPGARLLSATIIGPSAALADALATAACVDGLSSPWLSALPSHWSGYLVPSEQRLGYRFGTAWDSPQAA